MYSIISLRKHSQRCGFTLTELAVVLLIAGLVLGGIWIVGEKVFRNNDVYRANQQIMTIVSNIRNYYGNAISVWPQANGTDITRMIDGNSLIPFEMRRNPAAPGNTEIDHALSANDINGTLAIAVSDCSFTVTNPGCFHVSVKGLSQKACIALLLSAPFGDSAVGIEAAHASTGPSAFFNLATGVFSVPLPFQSSIAKIWCNAVDGNNDISFMFKLHS